MNFPCMRTNSSNSPIFLACSMIVSKYKSSLILIPPTLYVLCLSFRNYQHTLFLLVIFFPTLRDSVCFVFVIYFYLSEPQYMLVYNAPPSLLTLPQLWIFKDVSDDIHKLSRRVITEEVIYPIFIEKFLI